MSIDTKSMKNFSSVIEDRSIRLGILAGLFLSLIYLSPSIFYSFPLSNVNLISSSMNTTPVSEMRNDSMISSSKSGNITELNEAGAILHEQKLNQSETDVDSINKEAAIYRTDTKIKEAKPFCDFLNRRSNICDMHGDIRMHGKSSLVVFVTSSENELSRRNESWRIRPYARKTDLGAMASVREITVKSSENYENPPTCAQNYTTPAIIFSTSGYIGNYFHDFTDVLVPLFLTSYQFNGEVRFLVTNFQLWWINKYLAIIKGLSRYEVINLDNDDRVHCFRHVIVGLNSHENLRIDTSKSPNRYSMVDFTKFLRTMYSLPRESPLALTKDTLHKPRLLIIARNRTRKFTNLDAIVDMAKNVGFAVTVGEADSNVAHFAEIVNTCDVMMGVHGAGLTNLVFLPTDAVMIQIVPMGLDWIARTYFDEPAKGMRVKYLEYKISVDESTLVELYPRDHSLLKDPLATFYKFGKAFADEMYLFKQNVKLDVIRFRPLLLKALELLHEQ